MRTVKAYTLIAVLVVSTGICAGVYTVATHLTARTTEESAEQPVGGPDTKDDRTVALQAENSLRTLRAKKAVLQRREEILRYQLQLLEEEQSNTATRVNPKLRDELRKSRNMLVVLLRDQQDADEKVTEFLKQIWEAEGRVRVMTIGTDPSTVAVLVSWPVEPHEGISAYFHDKDYEATFGLVHSAIDIPVPQETPIHAAASGVVEAVVDNGMGYNYIIVHHKGYATLYGHVLSFAVQEGQMVHEGDVIGYTGGIKGTPGAGEISTGPHLHFEVIVAGEHKDPLAYLPYLQGLELVEGH